jgi:putative flippase GtrA
LATFRWPKETGVASATPSAALSGPIIKAPGFAGGYLPALSAIASNFWFNNVLTYRDRVLRGSQALRGFALFTIICAFGYISNIGVANWIFSTNPTWWLAGACGAVISAVWNYSVMPSSGGAAARC